MPEILRRNGWKIHFYATDGNERRIYIVGRVKRMQNLFTCK